MEWSEPASTGRPRFIALGTTVIGAAVSVALTWHAGRANPSRLLVLLFVLWVLAPFVALFRANLIWRRWSERTRGLLQVLTFLIAIGSLACYGARTLRPVGPSGAFVFLVVPLASWLLIAIPLVGAALHSRRTAPRGPT